MPHMIVSRVLRGLLAQGLLVHQRWYRRRSAVINGRRREGRSSSPLARVCGLAAVRRGVHLGLILSW